MDDAVTVRRVERVRELNCVLEHLQRLDVPRGNRFPERVALEQLHRDEELPPVFVDVVDRADVRMVERRRRAGLPCEPLDRGCIAREIRREAKVFGDTTAAIATASRNAGGPLSAAAAHAPNVPAVADAASVT